jgi:hypothetical protein
LRLSKRAHAAGSHCELGVELMKHRMSIIDSAKEVARQRSGPILMTSFAFNMGILPMARATGAGAYGRNLLGIVIPLDYLLGERIIPLRNRPAPSQTSATKAEPRRSK